MSGSASHEPFVASHSDSDSKISPVASFITADPNGPDSAVTSSALTGATSSALTGDDEKPLPPRETLKEKLRLMRKHLSHARNLYDVVNNLYDVIAKKYNWQFYIVMQIASAFTAGKIASAFTACITTDGVLSLLGCTIICGISHWKLEVIFFPEFTPEEVQAALGSCRRHENSPRNALLIRFIRSQLNDPKSNIYILANDSPGDIVGGAGCVKTDDGQSQLLTAGEISDLKDKEIPLCDLCNNSYAFIRAWMQKLSFFSAVFVALCLFSTLLSDYRMMLFVSVALCATCKIR